MSSNSNKCDNLVTFFNEAYQNYKEKSYNKNSCLKKVHMFETKELDIKIPSNNTVSITLSEDDNIYKPIGFVLSNLDHKIFTNKEPNQHAFKSLELILNILDAYNLFPHKTKDRRSKEKLLSNITINKDIVSIIQLGNYIFTIPGKLKLKFNVRGENLAVLTIDKLNKRRNKNKRVKIIRNKNKI